MAASDMKETLLVPVASTKKETEILLFCASISMILQLEV